MMNEQPFMTSLAYRLLALIARMVCLTLRIRRVNAAPVDELRRRRDNCVIAFWHGSMIPGWFFHRPGTHERAAALVSLSKDGAILASVLEQWGFRLIRGSSHIGGKDALHMMVAEVERGSTLCLTPDGPRGPRHVMKAGALLAAQRAGVPLVIAGVAVKKKKVLARSWDKFEIPMPFSEVCIWYDEPIEIPRALQAPGGAAPSDDARRAVNELLESLQSRLVDVHAKAHHALGIDPV
jgi:lysophospholipid acyltransferase (LPLAT)-like uncharacterized protein